MDDSKALAISLFADSYHNGLWPFHIHHLKYNKWPSYNESKQPFSGINLCNVKL